MECTLFQSTTQQFSILTIENRTTPNLLVDFFRRHHYIKYEVSTHKIMQDSTNTRDLDKKFVQTPRTQPGYVGKFSIFIVVLIFLFTFQNVNNKIKTTTENLPTQAGCVPGIPTDFLSKSLVFVESCTILRVDTSYLYVTFFRLYILLKFAKNREATTIHDKSSLWYTFLGPNHLCIIEDRSLSRHNRGFLFSVM